MRYTIEDGQKRLDISGRPATALTSRGAEAHDRTQSRSKMLSAPGIATCGIGAEPVRAVPLIGLAGLYSGRDIRSFLKDGRRTETANRKGLPVSRMFTDGQKEEQPRIVKAVRRTLDRQGPLQQRRTPIHIQRRIVAQPSIDRHIYFCTRCRREYGHRRTSATRTDLAVPTKLGRTV